MLRVTRPFAVSVAAGALFAYLMPIGASAQNPGIQELLNRVDRLQRELTTLQRHVYQGKTPPAAAGQPVPAAPTPSDPRTAARHSIRIVAKLSCLHSRNLSFSSSNSRPDREGAAPDEDTLSKLGIQAAPDEDTLQW